MVGSPAKLLVDAATVRIGSVLAIPDILRELGADTLAILEQSGLDIGLFDDPDNTLSFAARSRLVQHCVEQTGCRHFGLLVGARNGLHSLGLLGLLMKYSPDVGSALQALADHLHLHGRGGMNTLRVERGRAVLSFDIYIPQAVATDQIGDGSVVFMANILRDLCGRDWLPKVAWFAHRKPKDVGPYQRLLPVPMRFDAERYAIVFDSNDLSRPIPHHDPVLHRYLQQQIDLLEAQQVADLPRQVRKTLRTAFAEGRFGAEHVARLFAMHPRTLNRRLHACGSSFRSLVEETRFDLARQLLRDSAMDIRQIAFALGYADSGAFTRAFRRWSGVTPGQWRVETGRDSGEEVRSGA